MSKAAKIEAHASHVDASARWKPGTKAKPLRFRILSEKDRVDMYLGTLYEQLIKDMRMYG